MKYDKKSNSSGWQCPELKKKIYDDTYRQLHVWDASKNKQLFRKLKEQGIEPNRGSWSPGEVKQLEDVRLFQNSNKNIDVFKIFHNKESRIVLKRSNFWDILSYKICRTFLNIQTRFRYLCQDRAGYKKGGFSQNERKYLKELVIKHGRDWPVISKLMNRSEASLSIVYTNHILNDVNRGPWCKEEKERFIFIATKIMKYNYQNNLPLFQISWGTVSDFVLSRSYHRCQYFGTKNKDSIKKVFFATNFTSSKKKAMVIYLYFSAVCSETEINWRELFILFNGQFNEDYLKKQFMQLVSEISIDFKCALKDLYEKEIMDLKVIYKRINFENIMKYRMRKPQNVAFLKAKYYLLICENNISNLLEKPSEEVIKILHTKYCSNKSTKATTDRTRPSRTGYYKESTHQEVIDLIDISSDDDEFVDVTLIPDNESDEIDVGNTIQNDFKNDDEDIMIID